MDYLTWLQALDRAHQYGSLNGSVLTSLHISGAVFSSGGYLSHDDILAALRIAAIGQNGATAEHYQPPANSDMIALCDSDRQWRVNGSGYYVYDHQNGWVHSDTVPPEVEEFFNA